MTIDQIENTALWQNTLAVQNNDMASKYRDRLRTALFNMRENVIPFVRNIHRDVLGLTVHEESHLDALWQTANCIAGDNFYLTPIEAFVFGASVLLHDTGLAVATYSGGIAELQDSVVWRDAEAGVRNKRGWLPEDTLSDCEKRNVLFMTLRKLHAEQAEKIISFTFKRPNREEAIPLLQDVGLHDALSAAIGRIAHSHHWNSSDLQNKLVSKAGTVPGFPAEWTLNELKIACLLRCADAAHIDSLRAPTMLFAVSDIDGVSLEHWQFQNKLNSVTRSKDKLVFYSGQPFGVDQASSWWLAYDTIQMIDSEIKSCNAILEETGEAQFAASGVLGVESPRLLSKTIRVEGWTPISAEVRVSDPVHLAKTLGGRNLYGSGAIAPIRELLQNAVDAVRARRLHQKRESDWGKIRLTIEATDDDASDVWVHVDDTGTGMSERVVTGPLIDFGKSFWSSALMEEEFPGLRSNNPKLVGKFGIGFFSVFLLGDAVRVITRRFDAGEASAVVLSFDELIRRPLLRRAATGELPLDYTTRVSVKLNKESSLQITNKDKQVSKNRTDNKFINIVVNLISSVDVDVEIIDRVNHINHKHHARWLESSPTLFLKEVCSTFFSQEISKFIESHQERVRLIKEEDGTVVGRAALLIPDGKNRKNLCFVSVGGFSSQNYRLNRYQGGGSIMAGDVVFDESFIVGILIGDTSDASRVNSSVTVSQNALTRWAQEQDQLIQVEQFTQMQRVSICHRLIKLGAEPSKLPFGFLGGKFASVGEFRKAISESSVVDVPLTFREYRSSLDLKNIEELTTPYFTLALHPTVAVVSKSNVSDFIAEEDRKEIIDQGGALLNEQQVENILSVFVLRYLDKITKSVWRKDPIYCIERVDLDAGNALAGKLQSWSLRWKRE